MYVTNAVEILNDDSLFFCDNNELRDYLQLNKIPVLQLTKYGSYYSKTKKLIKILNNYESG